MLSHMLGNHPDVLGLNELHFIGRRWNVASDEAWPHQTAVAEAARLLATARRSLWDDSPTAEENEEAARLFAKSEDTEIKPHEVYEAVLTFLATSAGKTQVIDQTPRNIVDAQALLELFPEARVVHLVRDPRAVLWSQRSRWRQRWIGAAHTPLWNAIRVFLNYHPVTMSKLWMTAYGLGTQIQDNSRYIRLRFEDVVTTPGDTLQGLCDFLGIEYDTRMLKVAKVGSSHVRHDASKHGVNAAAATAWQGKMPGADKWICESMVGTQMDALGYHREHDRIPVLGMLLSLIRFPFHLLGVACMTPRLAVQMLKAAVRSGQGA
jgi:hypothetical protein